MLGVSCIVVGIVIGACAGVGFTGIAVIHVVVTCFVDVDVFVCGIVVMNADDTCDADVVIFVVVVVVVVHRYCCVV